MSSPLPPQSKLWLFTTMKRQFWRIQSGKLFGFTIGGPTDELHPFTKSSETGLGQTTDSTALPRGILQISKESKTCCKTSIYTTLKAPLRRSNSSLTWCYLRRLPMTHEEANMSILHELRSMFGIQKGFHATFMVDVYFQSTWLMPTYSPFAR